MTSNTSGRWEALSNRKAPARVALLRSASSRLRLYKWYWLLGSREPHLGLLYVASYLRARGCEVVVLDGEKIGNRKMLSRLESFEPDVIGITSNTFSFWDAARLAKRARSLCPSTLMLMGGAHATALPERTLEQVPQLDACVVSEGEQATWEIASGHSPELVTGLVWRNPLGESVRNPARHLPDVLDDFPLDWSLAEGFPAGYGPALQSARQKNPISLVASRGCPFQCTFCAGPVTLGRKRRAHSPARLVDMMTECFDRFGTTHFYFHDDHFTVDKPWLREFCRLATESNAPLAWSCASRVEPLTGEVLNMMRQAGCYQIGVGGESGSTEVLAALDKRTDPGLLQAGVRRIQNAGIEVKLYIIIGTPGERARDLVATRSFVKKLGVDHVQVLYFTPLPGTSSWREFPVPSHLWPSMNLLNRMDCSDLSATRLRWTELALYFRTYGLRQLRNALIKSA